MTGAYFLFSSPRKLYKLHQGSATLDQGSSSVSKMLSLQDQEETRLKESANQKASVNLRIFCPSELILGVPKRFPRFIKKNFKFITYPTGGFVKL